MSTYGYLFLLWGSKKEFSTKASYPDVKALWKEGSIERTRKYRCTTCPLMAMPKHSGHKWPLSTKAPPHPFLGLRQAGPEGSRKWGPEWTRTAGHSSPIGPERIPYANRDPSYDALSNPNLTLTVPLTCC